MVRLALAAVLVAALFGVLPDPLAGIRPAAADGFMIVLQPTVAGATTLSGAVRNVPPGTVKVKLELRLKSGEVREQTIDQYSNGLFLFKDVPTGSWVSLRATAQGGVAEQVTEVGPEAAAISNGYGDGNYQGYQGPYYFPGYLGVNGSGYAYPGNYGYPSYGPWGYAASYFYPGAYAYPGAYSYPGLYYYPGYAGYGGTYPGYGYPNAPGFPGPYGYPGYGYGHPGYGYSYPIGGYGYPGMGYGYWR